MAPGNSPGITVWSQVDPSLELDWELEFTGLNPDYNPIPPADCVNDVVRITGAVPFLNPMTAANEINIYFRNMKEIAAGTVFTGGFHADLSDFTAIFQARSSIIT